MLTGEVQPRMGLTPYVRFGNTPVLIIILRAWRRRDVLRGGRGEADGNDANIAARSRRKASCIPSPRRALDYLDIAPPEPGHAVQIGERLWWARIPLPMELNHINVWLMDDGDGWTLVDTGMAEEVCREAWGTLDTYLQGRPLRRIFITHDHPDHMGLSPWLAQKHGAGVWMSPFAHALGRAIPGDAVRRTAAAQLSLRAARTACRSAPSGEQQSPRGQR